jgi:hypothetical protein
MTCSDRLQLGQMAAYRPPGALELAGKCANLLIAWPLVLRHSDFDR